MSQPDVGGSCTGVENKAEASFRTPKVLVGNAQINRISTEPFEISNINRNFQIDLLLCVLHARRQDRVPLGIFHATLVAPVKISYALRSARVRYEEETRQVVVGKIIQHNRVLGAGKNAEADLIIFGCVERDEFVGDSRDAVINVIRYQQADLAIGCCILHDDAEIRGGL